MLTSILTDHSIAAYLRYGHKIVDAAMEICFDLDNIQMKQNTVDIAEHALLPWMRNQEMLIRQAVKFLHNQVRWIYKLGSK